MLYLIFLIFYFWKNTHKMCHQIDCTKEACRNSHQESLYNRKHIYVFALTPRWLYFSLVFCSCLSSQTCIFQCKTDQEVWQRLCHPQLLKWWLWKGPCSSSSSRPAASTECFGTWGHGEVCEPSLTVWHHRYIWMTCSGENTTQKWATNSQYPPKQCTLYHAPSMEREVVQSQNHSCVCSLCGHSNWLHL